MDFTIRRGEARDMADILELINELATIKKTPNPVTITMYDLINCGFSKAELFTSYVAEIGDKIVGFMLFTKSYSISGKTLRLEDVFVSSAYKKRGIGISLFSKFLEYAEKANAHLLEWVLQERFKNLLDLYTTAGAKVLDHLNVYKLTKDDIKKLLVKKDTLVIDEKVGKLVVRNGEMKDMANVLELIEDVCEEKNVSCKINIYDLMKDGFTKNPFFKTIVAEKNREVIAAILFYDSFSTLKGKSAVIEEIFVKSGYRGTGVGKLLSNHFFEYANTNKVNRIMQIVSNKDELTINRNIFFGAKKIEDLKVIRITREELRKFINS